MHAPSFRHALLAAVLICAAAALPSAWAEDAAVAVTGAQPNALTLLAARVGRDVGAETPLLSGVEVLSVLPSGFARAFALDPDRPRPVLLPTGGKAVRLPGPEGGLLVHYRRAGGVVFGFAHVDARGRFSVLIERPGLGPAGDLDPFERLVGVSPDGARVAITAPTFKKGVGGIGDCWIFALSGTLAGGAKSAELTGGLVRDAKGSSLTFLGPSLFAIVDDALEVAPADGSAPFQAVAVPGAPTQFAEEFAVSGDGQTLAFLAGASEALVDLFVTDAAATVKRVTDAPSDIEPPGYLPDAVGGPFLALSEDGSHVAYVRRLGVHREVFVESAAPGAAAQQVTGDANFDPSIDNPSGLLSGGALTFRFFMDSGQLNADLYEVRALPAGSLSLANLTATSGASTPFFPNAATIAVRSSFRVGSDLVFLDDRTAQGRGFDLWRVDAAGLAEVIATALPEPPEGRALAADAAIFFVHGATRDAVLGVQSGAPAHWPFVAPPGVRLSAPAVDPTAARVAFFAAAGALGSVVALDLATGVLKPVPGGPYLDADGLAFTGSGTLLFAAGSSGARQRYRVLLASSDAAPIGPPEAVAGWLP